MFKTRNTTLTSFILKRILISYGIKQYELSGFLSIPYSTVNKILNSKIEITNDQTLDILKYIGIKADLLNFIFQEIICRSTRFNLLVTNVCPVRDDILLYSFRDSKRIKELLKDHIDTLINARKPKQDPNSPALAMKSFKQSMR